MPLKIYFIDDEPDLLELFVDYFSSPQVEIFTFTDPEIAMAHIMKTAPDLLFLDYRLPNTTGDEIALSLDPSIPKILISGEIHVELKAKYEAIFNKPIPLKNVEDLIQKYLSLKN